MRGPTNHSRGSEGQSPERPTGTRRQQFIDPLWVGLYGVIVPVRPPTQGRSLVSYGFSLPPVVRSFAPPTGGYDSSDRKRSASRLGWCDNGRPPTGHAGPSLHVKTLTLYSLTQRTLRPSVPTKGYTSDRSD